MSSDPARRKAPQFVCGVGLGVPIAGMLLVLAGCSSPAPPPPVPPTVVSLQVSAAANVNTTPEGQGAPVAVRVYQLGSKSGFEGAEFYPLYNTDAAILGSDLVKKDEWLLTPGASKSVTLMPTDPVHAIGVFAAYRDFQNVTWRAATDVAAHQTTKITITADRTGIKLAADIDKPTGP